MRKVLIIFIVFILAFVSCDVPHVEKPKNLIGKKKMIEMLVEIHMAEATFIHFRNDSIYGNSTSADFYYSILNKHQMQDSLFEKSFLYYASTPKEFEKMYREVMNILSETEQEFSGRKNELIEFEEKEKK